MNCNLNNCIFSTLFIRFSMLACICKPILQAYTNRLASGSEHGGMTLRRNCSLNTVCLIWQFSHISLAFLIKKKLSQTICTISSPMKPNDQVTSSSNCFSSVPEPTMKSNIGIKHQSTSCCTDTVWNYLQLS